MTGDEFEAAGALATAGLAAHVVDVSGTGRSGAPAASAHATACRNCGASLSGAYCSACGQAARVHRSLRHLVEELLHGVFHFDAKGWRTLPLLVTRPGVLTRRYIDGQRVRYVSPLALFLFMIFLMFFAASLSGRTGVQLRTTDDANAELKARLVRELDERKVAAQALDDARRSGVDVAARQAALDATKKRAVDTADALRSVQWAADAASRAGVRAPASDAASAGKARSNSGSPARAEEPGVMVVVERSTGNARVDGFLAHAVAQPELTLYKMKSSAYKYAFLLVPISLPFVWLLFPFRRDFTAYDHAVFVLYSLSFMALLFVLLVILGALRVPDELLWLACVVPPVHMALQLRDTYGLGLGGTLWRSSVLIVVAAFVTLVFTAFTAYMAVA